MKVNGCLITSISLLAIAVGGGLYGFYETHKPKPDKEVTFLVKSGETKPEVLYSPEVHETVMVGKGQRVNVIPDANSWQFEVDTPYRLDFGKGLLLFFTGSMGTMFLYLKDKRGALFFGGGLLMLSAAYLGAKGVEQYQRTKDPIPVTIQVIEPPLQTNVQPTIPAEIWSKVRVDDESRVEVSRTTNGVKIGVAETNREDCEVTLLMGIIGGSTLLWLLLTAGGSAGFEAPKVP